MVDLRLNDVRFVKEKWPSYWVGNDFRWDNHKPWVTTFFAEHGIQVDWLYGEMDRFIFASEDDENMALMMFGDY